MESRVRFIWREPVFHQELGFVKVDGCVEPLVLGIIIYDFDHGAGGTFFEERLVIDIDRRSLARPTP